MKYSYLPNITKGVKIPTLKIARKMWREFVKKYPEVKTWEIYIDGQLAETATKRRLKWKKRRY